MWIMKDRGYEMYQQQEKDYSKIDSRIGNRMADSLAIKYPCLQAVPMDLSIYDHNNLSHNNHIYAWRAD